MSVIFTQKLCPNFWNLRIPRKNRTKKLQCKCVSTKVMTTVFLYRFPFHFSCFAAYSDGENDFIVLDDLAQYGYSTVSSHSGLSLADSQRCLESLGRFHGLSLALHDQHPQKFETLTQYYEELCFEARQKTWYMDCSKKFQDIARDAVHQEYPDSDCAVKMEQFFDGDFFEKMVKLAHSRTKYALLNHGDCWTSNFLLRNETDDAAAHPWCKLIDFQIARYGSPALDLSFFIYSCTTQALRAEHYDQLLDVYHQSATAMINALGSNADNVFPFAGLQSEMKMFARFGVGMSIESIPFSVINDEDIRYLDSIEGSDPLLITKAWICKIAEHNGRLRLADTFKHATECGYLD
jgi:hypothetical protein